MEVAQVEKSYRKYKLGHINIITSHFKMDYYIGKCLDEDFQAALQCRVCVRQTSPRFVGLYTIISKEGKNIFQLMLDSGRLVRSHVEDNPYLM
ncbi:hypothetical protein J6590_094441 [Homalodisca vitripennis]|nr:hypothetical protein J6590_094441 [Homalodisca vitripennis]